MLKGTTATQQDPAPECAKVAMHHPSGEPLLPPKYLPGFTDFKGLHRDILPFYSERSLRQLVRNKTIPSILLPRSRKRIFDVRAVEAAIRRHTITS